MATVSVQRRAATSSCTWSNLAIRRYSFTRNQNLRTRTLSAMPAKAQTYFYLGICLLSRRLMLFYCAGSLVWGSCRRKRVFMTLRTGTRWLTIRSSCSDGWLVNQPNWNTDSRGKLSLGKLTKWRKCGRKNHRQGSTICRKHKLKRHFSQCCNDTGIPSSIDRYSSH